VVRSPSNAAPKVEVWESLVIELLLTISTFQHPFNWDTLEAGQAGLQRIRQGMSPELERVLADLDLTGEKVHGWSALAAWTWKKRLREPEAAAAALADAPEWPADVRPRLAEAIRLWHRDLLAGQEADLRDRLHRAAVAKRRLAAHATVEQLIEEATNGIVWRPQADVRRVVLVPNVAMSPWSNHERVGDTMLFTFPAVVEPTDPMERIQRLSWVLADRSRLAALRLLAERTMTLQELADELGVRKSTMHHHLSLLRAAGLLRAPMGTKTYTLRRAPLDELGGALQVFGRER